MELLVQFHDRACGQLTIDNAQRMSFEYLPDYLESGGPPISVVMPLRHGSWPDAVTFAFFENLLPEGRIRQLIASRLGTADNNFRRLLQQTGGDVAGAISLVNADQDDLPVSLPEPLALTDQTLGQVLEQIKTEPFLTGNQQGMRLSLAGAQNKLPVVIDAEDQIRLPGSQISTHIIKPPSEQYPALVENEVLCMRAAARAGINVPETALRTFIGPDGQYRDCYVVRRYDRKTVEHGTVRLHQEDLCQITGIVSACKYVQDGGPGFAELFSAVRQYTRPAALYQQELVKRFLYNLLIGNQDAHGKNFSLLHGDRGISLSPAYDLVSTLVYPDLQDRFAMPIGDAWRIQELDANAMSRFQQLTGIQLKRQTRLLQRFVDNAARSVAQEAELLKDLTFHDTHTTLDRIVQLVRNHAVLLHQWLGA